MKEISTNANYEIRKNSLVKDESTATEHNTQHAESLGSTFSTENEPVIENETLFGSSATNPTRNAKKASEIQIPIGNSDVEQTEEGEDIVLKQLTTDTSETMSEINNKIGKLKISKNDVLKAKAFLDKVAQEIGINPDDLSEKEKELYFGLSIAYDKGLISKELFIKTVDEFGSEQVANAVKANFPDGISDVDETKMERIRQTISHVGKMRSIYKHKLASSIYGKTPEETKKLREEFLLDSAKDITKYHKALAKIIFDSLPEDCPDEVKEKMLGMAKDAATSEMDSTKILTTNRGFSLNYQRQMELMRTEILNQIKLDYRSFMKAASSYFNKKIAISKNILEHKKDVADKKIEEAQLAQEKAARAKSKANELKEKAKKILNWFGVNKATDKVKDKVEFIRHNSPRLFIDAKYAISEKKRADEAEYDANIAKKLAQNEVDWAEKSLSFASAQRDVFFIMNS